MFNPVEKTPLDVVFKINRMNFRIEHRAVENAKKIPEVVFPSPHKAADISELSDIK